jgi:hypothetical protein
MPSQQIVEQAKSEVKREVEEEKELTRATAKRPRARQSTKRAGIVKQSGMGVAKRQKSAPKKPVLKKRVVLSADKLDIFSR